MGFAYAEYRRELHEFAWKLAASALGAWVLVVCGFPIIFRRSLVRPLRALLDGVQQVSSGNFRASIPALSEDEVGRLANGYNRMVESLRSMEGNFKALAENAHDAILILSGPGRILFANARACALTGAPPNELLGSDARRFWTNDEVGRVRRSGPDAPGGCSRSHETRLRRSDGSTVPVEVTAAPTLWQDRAAEVLIVRNVSERKRAEEELRAQAVQLLRSEKLSSLGELVAGIAHEINNPNHVVSMNVRFLKEGVNGLIALSASSAELGDELRIAGMPYERFTGACASAMADIERSAQRIDHIVGELKRFVRGAGGSRERIDFNEVVRSVVGLSRSFIDGATSSFCVELDEPLPAVIADFVELEQVVLNLIENACQSLPSRDRGIRVTTRRDASAVVLTVADEGRLSFESEPGAGTRATVWLPAAPDDARHIEPAR